MQHEAEFQQTWTEDKIFQFEANTSEDVEVGKQEVSSEKERDPVSKEHSIYGEGRAGKLTHHMFLYR